MELALWARARVIWRLLRRCRLASSPAKQALYETMAPKGLVLWFRQLLAGAVMDVDCSGPNRLA